MLHLRLRLHPVPFSRSHFMLPARRLLLTTPRRLALHHPPLRLGQQQQLHSHAGNFQFPPRPTAPRCHATATTTTTGPTLPSSSRPTPLRQAVDPLTLLVVVAVSATLAYFAIPSSSSKDPHDNNEANSDYWKATSAREAQLTMAPTMPPGRPGNLSAEQETKLKEMWAATLDVFGVSHETHDETNSGAAAATATETTGSAPSTPEAKKKRKSRLGFLGKKDKSGSSGKDGSAAAAAGADSAENDKHGQTKEFQQALASQTPEQLRDAFWSMTKHDHPDALLLRFLRARKWDVQAALIMMVSTMHWRSQEMHVDDDIMVRGEEGALKETKNESGDAAEKKEGEDFLAQLRLGKSFVHGVDKEGRPCCYVRVRLHRQGEQSERSLERFTVYTIETTRMMLRPPVDTATIVFDMTDFSMANMDYTPVKFMIKCFEANYPESLGSVLVYRAPWIFQGIWKIIKGWLDPVVASKVHFASHVEDLSEWIPRSQIMKELGGDEDWTYSYVEPVEGENGAMEREGETKAKLRAEREELVKSYEGETLEWVHGDDEGQGRNRLAERLAENYWRIDPLVRARSLYDRTGIIGANGKLDFYPKAGHQAQQQQGQGAGAGGDDDLD